MTTTAGAVHEFPNVSVIVAGPNGFKASGFDDGASIAMAPQGEKVAFRKGNDGLFAFARMAGDHFICTLTFLSNSKSNDKMSLWFRSGLAQGLTVYDGNNSGATVFAGVFCMPSQWPPVTFTAGVGVRAWPIHMGNPEVNVGGQEPELTP